MGRRREGPLRALESPREPDPRAHPGLPSAPGAQPNGTTSSAVEQRSRGEHGGTRSWERVQVRIRLRPLKEREVGAGDQEAWSVRGAHQAAVPPPAAASGARPLPFYHFGTPTPARGAHRPHCFAHAPLSQSSKQVPLLVLRPFRLSWGVKGSRPRATAHSLDTKMPLPRLV